MTTISIATRCPDTKWISGILNLSLGVKPLLTVVSMEPFRDEGAWVSSGDGWGASLGPCLAQGQPRWERRPFWIIFTNEPEERVNSRLVKL